MKDDIKLFENNRRSGQKWLNQFFKREPWGCAVQDQGEQYFMQEYMGELATTYPEELYTWAEEYIYRTEKFDRSICGERGIPRDGYEYSMCNRNADRIKEEYKERCRIKKYPIKDFNRLIRELDRDLERIMSKYG